MSSLLTRCLPPSSVQGLRWPAHHRLCRPCREACRRRHRLQAPLSGCSGREARFVIKPRFNPAPAGSPSLPPRNACRSIDLCSVERWKQRLDVRSQPSSPSSLLRMFALPRPAGNAFAFDPSRSKVEAGLYIQQARGQVMVWALPRDAAVLLSADVNLP